MSSADPAATAFVLPSLSFTLDADQRVYEVHVDLGDPVDVVPWLGQPLVDRFAVRDRESVAAAVRAAAVGEVGTLVARLHHGARDHAVVLRIFGGHRFVLVTANASLNSAELDDANEGWLLEQGLLTGHAMHDLRNVLSAILVNVYLLQERSDEPQAVRELAGEVAVATHGAHGLMQQLIRRDATIGGDGG